MRFIDKSGFIGRLFLSFTVVDIWRRDEGSDPVGHIYPLFSADNLTIEKCVGFSLTIPVAKVSIGFDFGDR